MKYSVPLGWYTGCYKDKKAPCKAGRPFSINHEIRPDKCVLVLHGYTGYPGEMVRPARDLHEAGFDVYVPRLPGHGTSGDDFSRSTEKDWLLLAENALKDLRTKYKTVYMAGHSMGGAITVITAAKHGVERIALMAPAVSPKQKTAKLKIASIFSKRKPIPWQNDPEYVMYYEDAPADDMYLGKEYWSYIYYRQLLALTRLMNEAMEKASSLNSETLVVTAGKDALIQKAWTDEFISKLRAGSRKAIEVAGCTHFLAYDKDKKAEDEAIQAVVDWLKNQNS